MTWFEDIVIGETVDLGRHRFDAEDIVAFARQFDPQPFHLSQEAGQASLFGGLAASGWHTAAVFARLAALAERAQGADSRWIGGDSLRWMKPVLAGDELDYRATVTATSPWPEDPAWGLVTRTVEAVNQRGEQAFLFVGRECVRRRPG